MKEKRKTIVCIFAHPDDESFTAGGTIAKFSKDNDVYVISATKGEAGKNSKDEALELAEIRAEELRQSAKVLGVTEVFFLGFHDGMLSNSIYHELAGKIQTILEKVKPEVLLTLDYKGNSGHIDHIVVAYVTTYVFHKLPFVKKLMLLVSKKAYTQQMKDYFIFFPPGYEESEVDEVIDVSDVWEQKLAAMHKHTSQMHDVEQILKRQKELPKKDYFLVIKK